MLFQKGAPLPRLKWPSQTALSHAASKPHYPPAPPRPVPLRVSTPRKSKIICAPVKKKNVQK